MQASGARGMPIFLTAPSHRDVRVAHCNAVQQDGVQYFADPSGESKVGPLEASRVPLFSRPIPAYIEYPEAGNSGSRSTGIAIDIGSDIDDPNSFLLLKTKL